MCGFSARELCICTLYEYICVATVAEHLQCVRKHAWLGESEEIHTPSAPDKLVMAGLAWQLSGRDGCELLGSVTANEKYEHKFWTGQEKMI